MFAYIATFGLTLCFVNAICHLRLFSFDLHSTVFTELILFLPQRWLLFFSFSLKNLFKVKLFVDWFVGGSICDWSDSCDPVYEDQLGFINLTLLVWIILDIQTHTHARCLLEYFHFIFDDLISLTHTQAGTERRQERLENSCVFLHVCQIFYRYRIKRNV